MKALELTVYPRRRVTLEGFHGQLEHHYEYAVNGRLVDEQNIFPSIKRMTDAELAAEYHSWHAHMNKMQWTEEVLMQQGEPEWPEETWDRLGERGNTLHRFATLMSYDE